MALGENIKKESLLPSSKQHKESIHAKQANGSEIKQELDARINVLDEAALVSETDTYGTIIHVNEKFCEVAKYTAKELIGKPHNVIRHPDSPKALFKKMWETIQSGGVFHGEIKNRAKDGSAYWVDATIAPVLDEDGKPKKYIAVRFDITERKRLEEENQKKIEDLKQKEGEFSQILHAIGSSTATLTLDAEGVILEANPKFLEFTGYNTSELIGQRHEILCTKEYASSEEYSLLWNNLKSGLFEKGTYKSVRKDGNILWLEGTYNPILNKNGEVVKIILYAQDVTERRQRNAENRGRLAATKRAYGVVELALDGTLLAANENFLTPLGYSEEEIAGKHHSILVEPAFAKSEAYKHFWEKLNRGELEKDTYKRIGKNGEVVWYDATYNPIADDEGNIIKVVKYAQDVTNRRLANSENRGKLSAISQSYGTIEYQLDGTILSVNEAFQRIVNYSEADLKGKNHSILCDKEYIDSNDYDALWAKMNHGEVDGGIYKMLTKNNQIVWLQASFTPIIDLDGKPFKVVQYATDVTEQIELQLESDKLKGELESRVSSLNAAALMSETDLYGTITFVNEKFCEVAGFTQEELLGKPHNIIRHPSNPKSVFKELWDTIQNGGIFQKIYRNKRKDGSHYWVDATIAPVLGTDGKPIRYIGLRFDVTAQIDKQQEIEGLMEGVGQSNAMIEYSLDRKILSANKLALESLGYLEEELIGKPHSFLLENRSENSNIDALWNKLKKGEFDKNTYKRFNKSGKAVWLEGTYNPIFDVDGNIEKIVQYAQDVTERRLRNSENRGRLAATKRAYGVVELALDGTLLAANENFLTPLGYTEEEIAGKHHSILVEPAFAKSEAYKHFWEKLNRGELEEDTYKRMGKNGKVVWYDATYNPITDDEGNLIKVVQYAQDVTNRRLANSENRGKLAAINESYGAIEFEMDGTIITANDKFLNILDYSLNELQGKHHKTICDDNYVRSLDYRLFWEKLNRGENETGEFKRKGKDGKEVWLQASYNPIKDDEGNLIKVAKYAQDVTEFKVAFNALSNFLAELKKGNFQEELDLQNIELSGDIADMIRNNQEMRDTIQSIVSEVNNVVQIAGNEGKLSARLQIEDAEGSWKELVDAINELLQSIYEPLQGVNETVTALSEGDLTKRFDSRAAGDIKQMGDSLNSAVDNLQALLLEIERESNVVDKAAEQMLDKSGGMERNTQTVVTEIKSINEGMIEQVAKTDESSRFVEGILKTSESTGEKAEIINTSAEQGVKDSQNGMSIVKKLVENMNEIANSANSTASSIHILTERSEEISRTLNVITDIASQTNLLALNAAIEAARAGDAGRGFAVVAEEIRKLAEDSRKSAVGIERVIQDVQKDVSLATKAIDKMEGSVKNGNHATQEASDVFQTILASNQQTLSISQEVVKATKEQQESITVVVKNIEKIVVVSEETASGTKSVSKSAEDLNSSMLDITSTSRNLAEVATKLKDGVSKFKLKKN